MSTLDLPTDVTAWAVSLTRRHPDGEDAAYLEWHALDHRPEQHRLPGMRGSLRVVSTPECRAARAAAVPPWDEVDHVMAYLFRDREDLGRWWELGGELARAGRMPMRLPSVEVEVWDVADKVAAPRVLLDGEVVPWRPAVGAYLVLGPAGDLLVDGVAGWWRLTHPDGRQLTWCFLDDDPLAVAERLAPRIDPDALLAAPFLTVDQLDPGRHLP